MALSVLSLNCNGIRDQSKRTGLLQWLRSLPVTVDVVCLQETHCVSSSDCSLWFASSGFLSCVFPGSNHSCGCIILHHPLLIHGLMLPDVFSSASSPFVVSHFVFAMCMLRIATLIVISSLRTCLLRLIPLSPPLLWVTLIMFSIDPWISVVPTPLIPLVKAQLVLWPSLMHAASLTSRDSCTPTPMVSPGPGGMALLPLTLIFVVFLTSGCPLCLPVVLSPVPSLTTVHFCCPYPLLMLFPLVPGCGNLIPPSFSRRIIKGKSLIKGLTIKYCCQRSKAHSTNRDLLVRLVDHRKGKVDGGSSTCVGPYHSALAELAKLDLEAARGAQIRPRARWVEEGECSSAYFFRLERKCGADRWISAIKLDDGTIVSFPVELCASFAAFYSSLFSASPTDPGVHDSLLSNVSSSLPPAMAALCEGHLSVAECLTALQGMATHKAPGLDGLPMEFYVKFWPILGSDLVNVLNSCFDSGCLSLSQRRGVISLSFKRGDRLDPKNWRPISLLNVNLKLAAPVIAGWLLKVIHLVVEKDHTCGVRGRYIGVNVALLCDVVYYRTSFDVPVAVLSLDQEKAFDRVDWDFMHSTLSTMGFGPSFISWVNLFCNHVQSAVNINGYLSPFFHLTRGVRQGCPLSPLLYVLVSEVLAVNIRCNPHIPGLSLPGQPPLSPISQYTDDRSLILSSEAPLGLLWRLMICTRKLQVPN